MDDEEAVLIAASSVALITLTKLQNNRPDFVNQNVMVHKKVANFILVEAVALKLHEKKYPFVDHILF